MTVYTDKTADSLQCRRSISEDKGIVKSGKYNCKVL